MGTDQSGLAVVVEDLEYLRDQWSDSVADPEIRRGSALLRRLLVEDQFGRAWRAADFEKQPAIVAPDLEAMLGSFDRTGVRVALAGGALHGGVYVAGITFVNGSESPEPVKDATDGIFEHPFALTDYLASPCAYVQGESISRRDLIKYVANVRGGVHLTSGSHARRREQELIRRVGRLEGLIDHHSKDGLFFELLSVGQSIGKTPDALKLIDRVRGSDAA